MKTYQFDAPMQAATIGKGASYVACPFDIRDLFGKGRVKVHATFDEVPYNGSIVNMGVKNLDGSICYILGIRKDIRAKLHKSIGDVVAVNVTAID